MACAKSLFTNEIENERLAAHSTGNISLFNQLDNSERSALLMPEKTRNLLTAAAETTKPISVPALKVTKQTRQQQQEEEVSLSFPFRNQSMKRSLSESSIEELYKELYEDQSLLNGKSRSADTSSDDCVRKMWRNDLILNTDSSLTRQSQSLSRSVKRDAAAGQFLVTRRKGSLFLGYSKDVILSAVFDVAIRVVCVVVFAKLERISAFKRIIHMEELWLYKNPRRPDIVPPFELLVSVIFGPFVTTLLHFALTRNFRDFRAASWTWTLILCLNGLTTSTLKVVVGRPRPDFFYRCFPNGVMVLNNATQDYDSDVHDLFLCNGQAGVINEGRKSFPSGHSSFAFAAFGFISLYIGAKLHAFNRRGRGQTWRLFLSLAPIVLATLVAISRYCDYHHHWQDVLVGAIIGICTSYFCYRQYYPSIFDLNCHQPYNSISRFSRSGYRQLSVARSLDEDSDYAEDDEKDVNIHVSENDESKEPCLNSSDKQRNKWI